mgnify:CR=1 FL=1
MLLSLSVAEVEVIVRVVVVFTLAQARADEMEADREPRDSEPDAEAVVNHNTVEEEALEATVHKVEEPLLGGVGTMVPDVATGVGALLVEVLLTVPGAVLHLGHSETLTVCESHVLHISEFIVGKTTSYAEKPNQLANNLPFTSMLSFNYNKLI